MAFCSKCGSELKEGMKFCSKCGMPVKPAANAESKAAEPAADGAAMAAAAGATAAGAAAVGAGAAKAAEVNNTAAAGTASQSQYPYRNNYQEPQALGIQKALKSFGGSVPFLLYIIISAAFIVMSIISGGGQTIIGIGILILLLPLGAKAALAGLVIIGLGCAPVYPCIIHSTPDHFGAENSQAVIGVQMASAYIGILLMPPLFGLLADKISSGLLPVFLLILLAVMILMHEKLNRR